MPTSKKTEKDNIDNSDISTDFDSDWLNDIDMENVEKSANLNIMPSIKVELNDVYDVIIKTLPKKIEFADGNEYFCLNAIDNKDKVLKQINCNAKSFRYHLAVLASKLGGMDKLIGTRVSITKVKADTKKQKNAEVYQINLIF